MKTRTRLIGVLFLVLVACLVSACVLFAACGNDDSVNGELESISVENSDVKTGYTIGERFSADGLVVTATYRTSSTRTTSKNVTDYALDSSDFDNTKTGIYSIKVSYTEGGTTATTSYFVAMNEKGESYELSYNRYNNYAYTVTGIEGNAEYVAIPVGYDYIPVEHIGSGAFKNNVSMTVLAIPDGIEYIEDGAFSDCSSLEIINIPRSIHEIGDSAFEGCTSLKNIYFDAVNLYNSDNHPFYNVGSAEGMTLTILTDVEYIPEYLFYGSNIKSVVFEDGSQCEEIEEGAFSECSCLTSIYIPASLTRVRAYAFYGCTALSEVYVSDLGAWCSINFWDEYSNPICYVGYLYLDGEPVTEIVIPDGVTLINYLTFANYTAMTSLTISDSVTSILSCAFYGCTSLTSVVIPDSVTYIWEAFVGCTSLESVVIGNGVTEIGYYTFLDCTSLTSITIGQNVEYIGGYAFCNCTSLTSIVIPNSVSTIERGALSGCSGLESIALPFVGNSASATEASSTTLFGYIFGSDEYEGGIETDQYYTNRYHSVYYIPASLTEVTICGEQIFYGAFYNCASLTSIIVSDNLTSIETNAFFGCTSLSGVYISSIESWLDIGFGSITGNPLYYAGTLYLDGELVTDVAILNGGAGMNYTFAGCTSLECVTISNGVTSIGYNAFCCCTSLTSVIISKDVKSIASDAFYCCTSLTGVYISSIEAWCEINFEDPCSNPLYYAGNLYLDGELVVDVAISDGVTAIGDYVFYNCTFLTSVTISDSVISMGNRSFYGCVSLTEVVVGQNLENIGVYAFNDCTSLTSITIPDSVTAIGNGSFYGCISLTEVVIGKNVESIGDNAFNDCTSLTSITIPDSVTAIGNRAFYECVSLTEAIIGQNVESIGEYTFYDCVCLESANIPDGVTEIGSYAFYNCRSLTSITFPDSVTDIGNRAFYNCVSLTEAIIDQNMESIGSYAFYYCISLTAVHISSLEAWCKIDFGDHYSNPVCYGDLYLNGELLTEITISDDITSIGEYVFYNCTSLAAVHISSIESWLEIEFGNQYGNPLYYAGNLYLNGELVTEVAISDGVTRIGYALTGCTSLEALTIPDSVTEIVSYAFSSCTSLTGVYISSIEAWMEIEFGNQTSNPLYYARNLYLNGELVTEVAIPDGSTSIGYAFTGCTSLETVIIPDSVTEIGDYAFYYCTSLTAINIPEGVSSIGNYAFYNCTSLMSVTIPDNVTSIGDYAFAYCSSLTSITIPENVVILGYCAFEYCRGLTEVYYNATNASSSLSGQWIFDVAGTSVGITVTIGANVESIPRSLFYGSCVTVVIFEGNACESIGYYAFANCRYLKAVYYSGTEEEWNEMYIDDYGNLYLLETTVYYYSETSIEDGCHWHYVDGKPVVWGEEDQ